MRGWCYAQTVSSSHMHALRSHSMTALFKQIYCVLLSSVAELNQTQPHGHNLIDWARRGRLSSIGFDGVRKSKSHKVSCSISFDNWSYAIELKPRIEFDWAGNSGVLNKSILMIKKNIKKSEMHAILKENALTITNSLSGVRRPWEKWRNLL